MLCFHGTTAENAKLILSGSLEKITPLWNCSGEDTALYVYPVDKADDEDEKYAIESAFEGGFISSLKTDKNDIVVLAMDIPDHLLNDDYSCDNMNDIASFIDFDNIKDITFINLYHRVLNPYYKPYILKPIVNNKYFSTEGIDPMLLNIVTVMGDDYDWAFESLLELPYNELSIDNLMAM